MHTFGRGLLVAAAVLLLGTAVIHASGCKMVAGWLEDLPRQQSQGLQLVWLTDSLAWAVASIAWIVAAYRRDAGWRGASLLLAAIPILTGIQIVFLEPRFFGGWLLMISGGLAVAGVILTREIARRPVQP